MFGHLLLTRLFFNLGEKRILHFLRLLLAFRENNIFFISTLEDRATLFEFNIHSVFNDSSSCLHVWKILFSLNWTVNLRLPLIEGLLHQLNWLCTDAVLGSLLWDLHECLLCFLRTELLFFSRQWLVLIKSEWRQFCAQSNLVFKSLLVSHSDLLLQLVGSQALLCILIFRLVLNHCGHIRANYLVLVVKMLLRAVNGSVIRMSCLWHSGWLLVVLKILSVELVEYLVVTNSIVRFFVVRNR